MKRQSPKPGKDVLLDIIVEGYEHGIGPGKLAELTGYDPTTIRRYAAAIGLRFGQGFRGNLPNPVPRSFLIVMARAGIGNFGH